jgi:hypothetical protein
MEEKIKYSIEKIIMKKYPVISGVISVKDLFSDLGREHSSFLGWNYVVDHHTYQHLLDKNRVLCSHSTHNPE